MDYYPHYESYGECFSCGREATLPHQLRLYPKDQWVCHPCYVRHEEFRVNSCSYCLNRLYRPQLDAWWAKTKAEEHAAVLKAYPWRFPLKSPINPVTAELFVPRKHRSVNRRFILRSLGARCQLCGSLGAVEVHHVKPVRIGGSDDLRNLTVLCERCHRKRVHADGTCAPPRPLIQSY